MEVASFSSLPVGILLWNGPEPSLTVVTKMTLSFGPAGFAIAETQEPLRGPRASRFGCPLELDHAGDFAPRKATCDVVLTGNAHADAPSLVIGANVRIGSIRKRFYALASARVEAIPLSVAYLREGPAADSTEVTVGPLSAHHPEREAFAGLRVGSAAALRREALSADFDFAYFNCAPEDQRLTAIAPGMDVRLHGLGLGGAVIHGQLPTRWPRIHVPDERRGHGLREVGLVCDTLWIDTDRAVCELTFRGTLVLHRAGALPARLISTLGEAFENVDVARIEARAAFARPMRATEPEDVEAPSGRPAQVFSPATADTTSEVLEELEPEPETHGRPPMEPVRMEPVRMEPVRMEPVRMEPVQAEPASPAGADPASAIASLVAAGLSPSSAAFFVGTVRTELDPRRKVSRTIVMPPEEKPPAAQRPPVAPPPPADPDRTMLHTVVPSSKADPERTMLHTVVPSSKADPERTMLHTGPPVRPLTLPFAGAPRRAPAEPRVPPPESGLPFLAPRGPQTLELPPEVNPALAAVPFTDQPLRRVRTLDFTPGSEQRAPLPFVGGGAAAPPPGPKPDVGTALPFAARPQPQIPPPVHSPSPMFGWPPAPVLHEEEEAPEPRTLAPPPPAAGVESPVRDTLPPAAGAESSEPITLVPPAPRGAESPARDTLPPMAPVRSRDTLPPMAAMPAIPFAPAVPVGLGPPRPMETPTPTVGPSDPMAAPPWAAGLGPARGAGRTDSLSGEGPRDGKLGLFTLERDAEIQLAIWSGAAPLHATLAAHGTDELTWREHRRLRDAALREEAEAGGNAKAIAVHEAIEHARRGAPAPGLPSLDLAAYAEVRVVLKDADDEVAALAARGIDLARWEQDHRHYRRRLLKDPAFAEQLRAEIEAKSAPRTPSAGSAKTFDPRPEAASPARKGHESPSHDAERPPSKSRPRVRKMGRSPGSKETPNVLATPGKVRVA